MDLINKWLNGKRNYHVGIIIYGQFGKDEKLKKYFQGPVDKLKEERLLKELMIMNGKPLKQLFFKESDKDFEIMPDTADRVLKAIRNEWMKYYQRMQYLRHELDRYEGNGSKEIAQRHVLAKEILELEQKCMAIWAKADHYRENGQLSDNDKDEDPLPADPIELAQLIETTKRNIRRNKQLSDKHPANEAYPLKVKKYEALLERIMKAQNEKKP